ncbi:hypothetical protein UACE39S_02987 [Ureibacillus acetophenoni]
MFETTNLVEWELLWMKESIFHRLYDTYHQDVFQFLIYLVKNRSVAEDLSHEVYVRVLKSYDRFEGKSSEKNMAFCHRKKCSNRLFSQKYSEGLDVRSMPLIGKQTN